MSITISFSGDNAAAVRDEALAFFKADAAPVATPNSEPATAPADDDDKDALVERAKELGVEGVSKRWGVPKLEAAIAEAEKAPAGRGR